MCKNNSFFAFAKQKKSYFWFTRSFRTCLCPLRNGATLPGIPQASVAHHDFHTVAQAARAGQTYLTCTYQYHYVLRHFLHFYNLLYSSSVTGSHHSLEAFSPAISTAR
jgi:hypothetical protein